jgi:DNA-binding NarL/FixJ family response regulator
MSRTITVLLVDDHHLVRSGFRKLLEDDAALSVVGEAGNGAEAIKLAEELKPDVVVMDMAMPELDGVQAILEIRRRQPEVEVLVLSMYGEDSYVRNAFQAGARGYLLKSALDMDLAAAVKAVAGGKQYCGQGVKPPKRDSTDLDDPMERLTQRERQVLQLIAQARSSKEIANILNLSVNTVNVHRTNLMATLNLHSTAELVLFAVRKGLISVPK